jgi:hypothetical protein
MKNRQSGDLFEVVLFVEGENFRDAVVLHDDAVNYVAHTRVVLQNALFDVIEEFREVIFLVGTNLDEMNLRRSLTSWLSISPTLARSILLAETRIFTISVMAQRDVQSWTSLSCWKTASAVSTIFFFVSSALSVEK